jgi:hypothetical protein
MSLIQPRQSQFIDDTRASSREADRIHAAQASGTRWIAFLLTDNEDAAASKPVTSGMPIAVLRHQVLVMGLSRKVDEIGGSVSEMLDAITCVAMTLIQIQSY